VSVYASLEDLRLEFEGTLAEDQDDKLQQKLDNAEEIVASYVRGRDVAAHIAAGHTTAALVRLVVCDMVLRVLRNPAGVAQQSAGPFSVQVDQAVASGKLYLTRDDRRRLGLRSGPVSVEMVDDALPYLAGSPRHPEPVIRSNGPEPEDHW
jgi:hypothetical protein